MKLLTGYLEKIDALTPRERVILFALLLAALWALVDGLLLGPLDKARKVERDKLNAAATQIAAAQDTLTRRAGQSDPARVALERLETSRRALDTRLRAAEKTQQRLVAAKDMTQVLQGLLHNQPGLRLAHLNTLAPEAVGLPANAKPEDAALFRQGVRITLAGNYEALLRYMESLEKLPVGFYWSRAELDASHHPEIELTLTLYTLSAERTWLTV
jgi:MSHA biogenesis protein MshJ